jgi:hypothetical protein
MTNNKYKGSCVVCGGFVRAQSGYIQKNNGRWVVYCSNCYFHADDKKDHSSYEDRECGDMAYEDRCAAQCGF